MACVPDKNGEPLKPCGKYIRAKDRQATDGSQKAEGRSQNRYRRTEQPSSAEAAEGGPDLGATKIHVGRCKGLEVRDLAPEQVKALIEKWLPTVNANPKPSADDKRLMAALQWWEANNQKEDDNVPY